MSNILIWDGKTQIPADATRALIVASDGMFQLKRIVLGGLTVIEAVTHYANPWDTEGLVPWGKTYVSLGFAEKIPQNVVHQAVAFFSAVYGKFHSEAIVFLFYAPSAPSGQHWNIVAPEQQVEGARCIGLDPGPAPTGWFLAGTIHSHGDMGGFHSGKDDHDEDKRDGVHVTVGGVDSLLNFATSVVIDGERFKLDFDTVIEGAPKVDFPAEWMARVKKIEPPPVLTGFGLSTIGTRQHIAGVKDQLGDLDLELAETADPKRTVIVPTSRKPFRKNGKGGKKR